MTFVLSSLGTTGLKDDRQRFLARLAEMNAIPFGLHAYVLVNSQHHRVVKLREFNLPTVQS